MFLRIDADRHPQERELYGVSIVPAFLFFYCGKEQERIIGCDQVLLEAKIRQYTQLSQLPDYFCDEDMEEQREGRHMGTTEFDSSESSTTSEEEMSPLSSHYSQISDRDYAAHAFRNSPSSVMSVPDMQNQRVPTVQKSPELVTEPATTVQSVLSLSQSEPTSSVESVQGSSSQPKPKVHTQLEPIEEVFLDLGFSISTINRILHTARTLDATTLIDLALAIEEEDLQDQYDESEWEEDMQYRYDVSDWEVVVLLKRMVNR